ncbi:hypothetical protein CcaCcLH18_12224 [Colletotrichum camelliae]|nr:hypothetical protein CcaCcLH18_12224 [Colletotrichum camelliae]
MAPVTEMPPSSISTVFRKLPPELVLMIADELISSTTSSLTPQHFQLCSQGQALHVVRRTTQGDSLAKERYLQVRTVLQINQRIRRAARKAYLPLRENDQKEWVCLEKDVFVLHKDMLQQAGTFRNLTPHNLHILQNLQHIVFTPYDAQFWGVGAGSRALQLMRSVNSIRIINAAFGVLDISRKHRLEAGKSLGLVPCSQIIQDANPATAGIPSLAQLNTSLSYVLGRLKSKNVRVFIQMWFRNIFEQCNKENSVEIINSPDGFGAWLS